MTNKVVLPTVDNLHRAAEIIRRGGLVAFPTETVYGLGANALDGGAAEKIYAAKGRPSDNPLIVHVANTDDVRLYAADIPEAAQKLMDAFWPGSLTLIFRKNDNVPDETTGGLDTVAIRVPSDKTAQTLITLAGTPIAAPSANISGRPSPTTAAHVLSDFAENPLVEMIIDGGPCVLGLESTIADVTGQTPVILRPGSITAEMLRGVCGEISYDSTIFRADSLQRPKAPGMKYRHYSPKTPLIVLKGTDTQISAKVREISAKIAVILTEQAIKYVEKSDNIKIFSLGDAENKDAMAANLYALLRSADESGVSAIYAQCVDEDGVGLSIMNRLKKATGNDIIML